MKRNTLIVSILLILLGSFLIYSSNSHEKESKTELVFWTLQLGTFDKYINNIISEFEKDNPNVKIKWVDVPYSEGEKRTLASILSDNPPDLVNSTPDFSLILAQKKALYLIDEKNMQQYLPSVRESLKQEGSYFSFPFYATSALTFYNKELAQKTGIKQTPKTYEELYSYAEAAKDNTNAYITMPVIVENDTMLKILNKYNINSPDTIASEKSVEIFDEYKHLYKNSLIPKESITQTHREALEKYMSGQIIFFPGGANFLNIIKENSPEIYKKTGVSPQLTGSSGKYDYSLMNLIIPKKAKNKELAVKFALFLTNKKNQLDLAKLTTILPLNEQALADEYFSSENKNDLLSESRTLSANQLKNVQAIKYKTNNQKELLNLCNNYVQQIVLNKGDTEKLLLEFSDKWKKL